MYVLGKCNKHYFIHFDYIFLFGTYLEMITDKGPVHGPRSRLSQSLLYCFLRKSLKLFFWGLEMCVINSYILYRILEKTNNETLTTYYKFIKLLIDHFKCDFRRPQIRLSKSSENRLNNKLHILDVKGKKRDCIVYSLREIPSGRRQANYFYSTCIKELAIHIGTRYYSLKKCKIQN
jgi:hypothetical protein